MGKKFNIKRVHMYSCDYCDKPIPLGELMPHLIHCAEKYTGEFNIDQSRSDILLYLFGIKHELNPKIIFNNELNDFSFIIYRTIFDTREASYYHISSFKQLDLLTYRSPYNYNKLRPMELVIMESYLECPLTWTVPIIFHLRNEIFATFMGNLWKKDFDKKINQYYQLYSGTFIINPDSFRKEDGLVSNYPYISPA